MKPGNFVWALPVPLGVAAYFMATASGTDVVETPPSINSTVAARQPRRDVGDHAAVASLLLETLREWHQLEEARSPDYTNYSQEDLRWEILRLKQEAEKVADDWGKSEALKNQLHACAHALGMTSRGDALKWIETNSPAALQAFVAGWAEQEPAEVLRYISAAEEPHPCYPSTLMSLLGDQASAGPEAMLTAAQQVPWELFRLNPDPFENPGLAIGEDTDLAPWLESGAARWLAEEGVRLDDLFSLWGKTDPAGALHGWAEWPGQGDHGSAFQLRQIFHSVGPGESGVIEEGLRNMDSETFVKVGQGLSRLEVEWPGAAEKILTDFPVLRELIPKDPQPGTPEP